MVQICEYLLVPYCLKGGIFPVRQQRFHLVNQPVVNHLHDPPVNPLIQFFPRTHQTYLFNRETTFPDRCSLE